MQVEDLYLTFAKRASAFNSWYENAEEDLTDPVRCNSLEEIRALLEAQEQFKANLSAAESDFAQLAALDKKIKSFNVGLNPYTWFRVSPVAVNGCEAVSLSPFGCLVMCVRWRLWWKRGSSCRGSSASEMRTCSASSSVSRRMTS